MTHVTHQWNEHWINSYKGSTNRNLFFPTVYSHFNSKYLFLNFILTQFLTGHGKFKTYLLRFKLFNKLLISLYVKNLRKLYVTFFIAMYLTDKDITSNCIVLNVAYLALLH